MSTNTISNPSKVSRPTWILEPRTAKEYKAANLQYFEDIHASSITKFNIKSKGDYDREVLAIYRIRDVYDNEYLVWNEQRSMRTKLGNVERITVNHLGKYYKPIPLLQAQYNENEEQEVIAKGTSEIQTKYELLFTWANLDDLLLDANRHTTELYIKQEGRRTVRVDSLDEFRNMPFDELYQKVQTPKHLQVTVAPKLASSEITSQEEATTSKNKK